MSNLPLCASLASSLLAASAASQIGEWDPQNPVLPFRPENRIAWPFGSSPQFGRVAMLELDRDQALDGVLLADGQAYVLWQPAYYDWVAPITFPTAAPPSNVKDVAALPVPEGPGSDLILMTDSRGLFKTSWNGSEFTDPVVIATGRWVNAGPFRLADVNGDAWLDLVGRAGDGLAGVTRMGNASGGFTVGQTLIPPSHEALLDVVAVNWDGAPGREIALLCADGLHVFNQAGTRTDFFPYTLAGSIAAFKASAAGDELLAWTRPTTAGSNELIVLGAGGEEDAQTLFFDELAGLGPFWNGSIVAGDYYNGGGDELVLVHESKAYAAVLYNTDTDGAHFAAQDDEFHDIVRLSTTSNVTGAGIPALADLDSDVIDDLVVPVEGTNEVLVFRTLPYFRGTNFETAPANSADIFVPHSEYSEEPSGSGVSGELRLAIRRPQDAYYASFTDASLKLWHAPNTGTNADQVAVGHWQGPLASQPDQWVRIEADLPTSSQSGVLCWAEPNQHHYFVELRLYKVVNGTKQWSPKFFGGFTLQSNCANYTSTAFDSWLRSSGLPYSQFFLYGHNGITPGGEGNGQTFVGSFVPMTAAPTYNATPPTPGPVSLAPLEFSAVTFW